MSETYTDQQLAALMRGNMLALYYAVPNVELGRFDTSERRTLASSLEKLVHTLRDEQQPVITSP